MYKVWNKQSLPELNLYISVQPNHFPFGVRTSPNFSITAKLMCVVRWCALFDKACSQAPLVEVLGVLMKYCFRVPTPVQVIHCVLIYTVRFIGKRKGSKIIFSMKKMITELRRNISTFLCVAHVCQKSCFIFWL